MRGHPACLHAPDGGARTWLAVTAALALLAFVLPLSGPPASAEDGPPATGQARFSTPLPDLPEITDSEITLTAAEAEQQILPGEKTRMWTYNGTYPGPIIRRPAGERTEVTLRNELPEEAGALSLHNHGNPSSSADDGQSAGDFLVERGEERTYTYELTEHGETQRAAMQWYHDHRHYHIGRNQWMGLAGLFIVEDDLERELGLPAGEFEVPLVVADRRFDEDNQLYTGFTAPDRPDTAPHEAIGPGWPPFDEIAGDRHLVNGALEPHLEVADRTYRLRILNGSNFVPYNFRLSNGAAMTQIGTESGLLPEPVERDSIFLGSGERADVIVDFGGLHGEEVVLESAPLDHNRPVTGPPVDEIMEFRVTERAEDDFDVPDELRPLPDWVDEASASPDRVWLWGLNPDQHGRMAWTVNGRSYEHGRADARPESGSVETWAHINLSPLPISHWIHLHHTDWVVVSRNGGPPEPYEAGPKETFRLDPGEVVLVAAKFNENLGPFVFHCHMLEHEDHGMMATFEVVPEGEGDRLPLRDPVAGAVGDILNR